MALAPRRHVTPPPHVAPQPDRLLAIIRLQNAIASAPLDAASAMQFIATRAMALLDADGALVALDDDVALRAAAAAGTQASQRGQAVPLAGSAEGRCLVERRPLQVAARATTGDDRFTRRRADGTLTLCAPITRPGRDAHDGREARPVGVLSVSTRRTRPFGPDDVTTLVLLADAIAAALVQAEQLATLHEAAQRDRLTGLGTRAAFDAALARELDRHHRYGAPLSLTLLATDGLDAVRVAHGHAAADRARCDAAAIILLELRTCDAAFRLAGDTFALLWPDTPLAGATIATARVVRHVAGARLGHGVVTFRHGIVDARGDEAPYLEARATAALDLARP